MNLKTVVTAIVTSQSMNNEPNTIGFFDSHSSSLVHLQILHNIVYSSLHYVFMNTSLDIVPIFQL